MGRAPGAIVATGALARDIDVDVAVVGAGFTGLWTAYYLLRAAPGTRVALLESQVAGYGASGRNGGWCSALFSAPGTLIAGDHGVEAARAMHLAMQGTVDEVGRAADAEGIDCRFSKGGTLVAARTPAQVGRAEAEVAESRALGFGEQDLRWMGRAEAEARVRMAGMLGATYTPHCAVLDPARLVRGLAEVVERMGATLYEGTVVEEIRPRGTSKRPTLRANGCSVTADVVVRATEAWAATLPGERRTLLPVYSLMIATEPLPGTFWAEAGLAERESSRTTGV